MKIVTIKIRENDRVLFAVDGKYWLLRPKKKIIKVHEGNITLYKARLLWDKLIENDYELIDQSPTEKMSVQTIPLKVKKRKVKKRKLKGISLDKDLIKKLSKELTKEIDREILKKITQI